MTATVTLVWNRSRRPNPKADPLLRDAPLPLQRVSSTPMDDQLCLLAVHAHPDDEASKGASTIALYHAEGIRTILVCCTGGEAGDILNPAMDNDSVRRDIKSVRRRELAMSAKVIGYDEVVMLGYRDSGMFDPETDGDPECFAGAPIDDVIDRLVRILRRERPQVVVTYPNDPGGYRHPDHIRVHEITRPAVDRAADATYRPGLGPAWAVSKIYYSVWSRSRIVARHEAFGRLGLESPYDEGWFERPDFDHLTTTLVPVAGFAGVRREALLAHASQIDPGSKFWFGLPVELDDRIHSHDEFRLAMGELGSEVPESDLFAGLRAVRMVG